jgi:aspartate aminotransferase-like enzyme
MTFTPQFRIPGPTPLPERVRRALARPMINHRGAEFATMMGEIVAGCRRILKTRHDVLILTASGTGGLESAAANLMSPGEEVLVVNTGNFGERFAKVLAVFGAQVHQIEMPWGQAADPDDIAVALARHPKVRVVVATHNETSTGVVNDIAALAKVVKAQGRLMVVDAVSSAASLPLNADGWGLDVVITGSQKGFMSPPGVAMVAVSPAAWQYSRQARAPRFYFDWENERKAQAEGATFTTPTVSVLFGLHEAIKLLEEEGLEAVFARHHRIGDAVRAGVESCGLRLLADPAHRSDTVTAVLSPPGLEGEGTSQLLAELQERYQLVVAGGQGKMAGRMLRIGHMGMISDEDAVQMVDALEQALHGRGLVRRVGAAVPAARQALLGATALPSA